MLRKMASTVGLTAIALSLLTPAASASERAQADLRKIGSFTASVSGATRTPTTNNFKAVSFGLSQEPGSPMTGTVGYYEEQVSTDGYTLIEGYLEGREAMAAVTLQGLHGAELHAVVPVEVCLFDPNTYERTCSPSTRRVDATVTSLAAGKPDLMHYSEPRTADCGSYCWSEIMLGQSRAANGTLSVDGVAADNLSARVGHYVGVGHTFIRPALAASSV